MAVTKLDILSQQGVYGRVFATLLSPGAEMLMARVFIYSFTTGVLSFLVGAFGLAELPFVSLGIACLAVAAIMCMSLGLLGLFEPMLLRRANKVIAVMRALDS